MHRALSFLAPLALALCLTACGTGLSAAQAPEGGPAATPEVSSAPPATAAQPGAGASPEASPASGAQAEGQPQPEGAAAPEPGPVVQPPQESQPGAAPAAPRPRERPLLPLAASGAPTPVIESVGVVGNVYIPTDTITKAIGSKPETPYSQDQVEKDRRAILALGYFQTVSVEQESVDGGIRLVFRVLENPVVTDIKFEGNTVLSREQLLSAMETKPRVDAEAVTPDMVFNRPRLLDDVRRIEDLYRSQGYILAMVADSRMSLEGVLTLVIAEGVIEEIRIVGNTHTKRSFMMHYIRTKVGDVYNDRQVAADVIRLTNLDLFDTVRREAEIGTEYGKVILVFTVVEKRRTGLASIGGGYSSVQGLVGFIDLVKTNLGGTGQVVSVRGEFGGRSSYEFGYRNPWIMNPETRLSLGLYNRLTLREAFVVTPEGENQSILYDERRTGGNITLGRPVSNYSTAFLNFRSDDVSISGLTESEQPYLAGSPFLPRQVRSITLAGVTDTRVMGPEDDRYNPHRGGYRQLSAEFAGLFGGADFNKYTLDSRRYFRVGAKNVLALRLLGGVTTGNPPYLEQFLIGGTESLRGFRSDRFAGARMAILNTEYRFPLSTALIGVVFADVGDAWGGDIADDPFFRGDKTFTAHVGYGVGVRVKTPIGPIRLDIGFSNEGTETHFGVSHMF